MNKFPPAAACGLALAAAFLPGPAAAQNVSTPVRLNPADLASRNADGFRLTPDGTRVLIDGNLITAGRTDFFTSPLNAFDPVQVNANPAVAGGSAMAGGAVFTPDGQRLIYGGDLLVDGRFDVYSASLTSANTQILLSDPGPDTADASLQVGGGLTADGRIVFTGDYDTDGVRDLYSASTTVPGTQIRLSPTLPDGGEVNSILLSPDGRTVAFSAGIQGGRSIYAAPTDGSAPAIRLTPADRDFNTTFFFTPDSSALLFPGRLDPADALAPFRSASAIPVLSPG